jgi:hypothetical protein
MFNALDERIAILITFLGDFVWFTSHRILIGIFCLVETVLALKSTNALFTSCMCIFRNVFGAVHRLCATCIGRILYTVSLHNMITQAAGFRYTDKSTFLSTAFAIIPSGKFSTILITTTML